jgi:hypothetical protein
MSVLVCARLVRGGRCLVQAQRPDHPDVRADVERRLAGVASPSRRAPIPSVGIRLASEVIGDRAFDAATNLGLKSDACALIVILWARLVLQKRTAQSSRETPGQSVVLAEHRADAAKQFTPQVRLAALVHEFGHVLAPSACGLAHAAPEAQVRGRAGEWWAGPLLEPASTGADGLVHPAQVLAQLLEGGKLAPPRRTRTPARRSPCSNVSAAALDLGSRAQARRTAVRTLLRTLIEEGRVRRVGARNAARYERLT